jgi:RimJ/RimL family protein N-acetyltransferase
MRELGGPVDRTELPRVHHRRLNEPWYFKIVPEPSGPAAGAIGIWETEHHGTQIYETGWMVLPQFQGRGIASTALGLLIERARAESTFGAMHAFPGITNAASNALCRRFGFSLLGEEEFEFRGRPLRCNHWALELTTDWRISRPPSSGSR